MNEKWHISDNESNKSFESTHTVFTGCIDGMSVKASTTRSNKRRASPCTTMLSDCDSDVSMPIVSRRAAHSLRSNASAVSHNTGARQSGGTHHENSVNTSETPNKRNPSKCQDNKMFTPNVPMTRFRSRQLANKSNNTQELSVTSNEAMNNKLNTVADISNLSIARKNTRNGKRSFDKSDKSIPAPPKFDNVSQKSNMTCDMSSFQPPHRSTMIAQHNFSSFASDLGRSTFLRRRLYNNTLDVDVDSNVNSPTYDIYGIGKQRRRTSNIVKAKSTIVNKAKNTEDIVQTLVSRNLLGISESEKPEQNETTVVRRSSRKLDKSTENTTIINKDNSAVSNEQKHLTVILEDIGKSNVQEDSDSSSIFSNTKSLLAQPRVTAGASKPEKLPLFKKRKSKTKINENKLREDSKNNNTVTLSKEDKIKSPNGKLKCDSSVAINNISAVSTFTSLNATKCLNRDTVLSSAQPKSPKTIKVKHISPKTKKIKHKSPNLECTNNEVSPLQSLNNIDNYSDHKLNVTSQNPISMKVTLSPEKVCNPKSGQKAEKIIRGDNNRQLEMPKSGQKATEWHGGNNTIHVVSPKSCRKTTETENIQGEIPKSIRKATELQRVNETNQLNTPKSCRKTTETENIQGETPKSIRKATELQRVNETNQLNTPKSCRKATGNEDMQGETLKSKQNSTELEGINEVKQLNTRKLCRNVTGHEDSQVELPKTVCRSKILRTPVKIKKLNPINLGSPKLRSGKILQTPNIYKESNDSAESRAKYTRTLKTPSVYRCTEASVKNIDSGVYSCSSNNIKLYESKERFKKPIEEPHQVCKPVQYKHDRYSTVTASIRDKQTPSERDYSMRDLTTAYKLGLLKNKIAIESKAAVGLKTARKRGKLLSQLLEKRYDHRTASRYPTSYRKQENKSTTDKKLLKLIAKRLLNQDDDLNYTQTSINISDIVETHKRTERNYFLNMASRKDYFKKSKHYRDSSHEDERLDTLLKLIDRKIREKSRLKLLNALKSSESNLDSDYTVKIIKKDRRDDKRKLNRKLIESLVESSDQSDDSYSINKFIKRKRRSKKDKLLRKLEMLLNERRNYSSEGSLHNNINNIKNERFLYSSTDESDIENTLKSILDRRKKKEKTRWKPNSIAESSLDSVRKERYKPVKRHNRKKLINNSYSERSLTDESYIKRKVYRNENDVTRSKMNDKTKNESLISFCSDNEEKIETDVIMDEQEMNVNNKLQKRNKSFTQAEVHKSINSSKLNDEQDNNFVFPIESSMKAQVINESDEDDLFSALRHKRGQSVASKPAVLKEAPKPTTEDRTRGLSCCSLLETDDAASRRSAITSPKQIITQLNKDSQINSSTPKKTEPNRTTVQSFRRPISNATFVKPTVLSACDTRSNTRCKSRGVSSNIDRKRVECKDEGNYTIFSDKSVSNASFKRKVFHFF